MCELLVGLPDVNVLAVDDQRADEPITVHVEARREPVWCRACGVRAKVKDRDTVILVDLPCFGRAARLAWHKIRMWCAEPACATGSWTIVDTRIAPPRMALTTRAARWATKQVGKLGRPVSDVADELGCDWHTVNDTVIAYGEALLEADTDRVGQVDALGLDETLFNKTGRWKTQQWCTSVVKVATDGAPSQLIDVVEGRTARKVIDWLDKQPDDWKAAIRWGVLDMSGPYRKVFNDALDHVTQVADPFHVIKAINEKLDQTRRRVQNETLGHRGRKGDPLYRARRLLTKAHERLDERGNTKLLGLLEAGDPNGEVRMAWHAKETTRSIYDIDDPAVAEAFVAQLGLDLQDPSCPPEIRVFGRTLRRWRHQICAWHHARVSAGPTEAINGLIKRIKRIGFGFRSHRNYRIRALLYAGRPNWALLDIIEPRWGDFEAPVYECPRYPTHTLHPPIARDQWVRVLPGHQAKIGPDQRVFAGQGLTPFTSTCAKCRHSRS